MNALSTIRPFPRCSCGQLQFVASPQRLSRTNPVRTFTSLVCRRRSRFIQDPSNASVHALSSRVDGFELSVNGVLQSTDFLTLTSSEIVSGGERGASRPGVSTRLRNERPLRVNFTNVGLTPWSRASSDRQAIRSSRTSPPDSICAGRAATRSSRSRSRIHNGGTLAIRRPDGYTLYRGCGRWRRSVKRPTEQRAESQFAAGQMLRISVAVPDSDPEATTCRPTTRFSTALRLPRCEKSGPSACATRGSSASTIRRAAEQAPCSYRRRRARRGGEEVDFQPAGRGAQQLRLAHPRRGARQRHEPPPAYTPLIEPIFEYATSVGNSITGGYVYRGSALSSNLHGRYFFADINGRVWSIVLTINGSTSEADSVGTDRNTTAELGGASAMGLVSSFGVDASGELYIVSLTLGRVFKISSSVGVSDSSSGAL